jgi:hypothetical protein
MALKPIAQTKERDTEEATEKDLSLEMRERSQTSNAKAMMTERDAAITDKKE